MVLTQRICSPIKSLSLNHFFYSPDPDVWPSSDTVRRIFSITFTFQISWEIIQITFLDVSFLHCLRLTDILLGKLKSSLVIIKKMYLKALRNTYKTDVTSHFFIFQNLGFSPNYCDICGKIIELKVSYHRLYLLG